MNSYFENTPIWKIIVLYLIANVLNYAIGLGLKPIFNFGTAVGGEVVRALLFAIIIAWFLYSFIKNNISLGPELKRFKKDFNIKEFSVVIIFNYAISLAMVLGLLLGITKLLPGNVLNSIAKDVTETANFASALIGLITASVLAPIAEELLFRGVLLNRLKNRYGVVTAIVMSSVLFGLTHMSLAMVRSAIFGACMCIVYLKTKNILVPIVLHMISNFLLTIAGSYEVLLGIKKTAEASLALNMTTTIIEIIVSIMVMTISVIYLSKKFDFFNLEPYNINK